MVPPPVPGITPFRISDAVVQAFTAKLQGVAAEGVGSYLPSPSTATLIGRVADLSLLHLRFNFGVVGGGYLAPIWEDLARAKGRTEGIYNLNQVLLMRIPLCWRVFEEMVHLRASLPLLAFSNNVLLTNPCRSTTTRG